jgi:acetoin utilization deacetylase AcuC-like enzyme
MHPERYDKLSLILPELEKPEYERITQPVKARAYEQNVLTRIHDAGYIQRLAEFSGEGLSYLDSDTYVTSTSFAASCRVTWSLLSAVDEAFGVGPKVSFIIGRPPGHHAEADRGMGFCLVNHIAVAAQYVLDNHAARRVAVVDFDIHHGNGTQHAFSERSDVFYISTHQYPFYPGSGAAGERGSGEGRGYTLNLPCPAGSGDAELLALFEGKISTALGEYRPDVILVSAGFDGHNRDPLGGFRLTGEGYGRIGSILSSLAGELCGGRLVSLLEGGYDPEGNMDSICNYLKGLAGA